MDTLPDELLLGIMHELGRGRLPIAPAVGLTLEKLREGARAFYKQQFGRKSKPQDRLRTARPLLIDARQALRDVLTFAQAYKRAYELLARRWAWIYEELYAQAVAISPAVDMRPPHIALDLGSPRYYEVATMFCVRPLLESRMQTQSIVTHELVRCNGEPAMYRLPHDRDNIRIPEPEALALAPTKRIEAAAKYYAPHMRRGSKATTQAKDVFHVARRGDKVCLFTVSNLRKAPRFVKPFDKFVAASFADAQQRLEWTAELDQVGNAARMDKKRRFIDAFTPEEEKTCSKARRF